MLTREHIAWAAVLCVPKLQELFLLSSTPNYVDGLDALSFGKSNEFPAQD